jgi:general secretion pathway protein G
MSKHALPPLPLLLAACPTARRTHPCEESNVMTSFHLPSFPRSSLAESMAILLPLATAIATVLFLAGKAPAPAEERLARARDDLRTLRSALIFNLPGRNGMPDTAAGLATLVDLGLLKHLPLDPWGLPYQYRNPGQVYAYELFSLGPDGIESKDDVVAWNLYGGR